MPETQTWRAALSDAFEILLRQPLTTFDANMTYALYHWDDILNDEFFEGGHALDELGEPENRQGSPVADDKTASLSPDRWRFDLGRSIFEIDDWEHPVKEQLRAVRLSAGNSVAVLGSDLRQVLADQQIGLEDLAEEFTTVVLRVQTDGSLFDAMRAATWTMSAPQGLVPLRDGAQIDEPWRTELHRVVEPALREHLQMLCLTAHWARSDGAHFIGPQCPGMLKTLTKLPGYTVVAGWELGEGQAASAIFQIKA